MSQADFDNKVDSFHNSQKNIGRDSSERKKAGHKGLFQVKSNEQVIYK